MYEQAKNLIKKYEGFRSKPYHCPGGYPTIGYGHKLSNRKKKDLSGYAEITEELADKMLEETCDGIAEYIADTVEVDLEAYQRDALISLVYNIGRGNFRKSTLLKKLNQEKFDDVPAQILRWVYAGGMKLKGLELRREAEADLFQG